MELEASSPNTLAEHGRRVGNLINLATPLGLVVATVGRARIRRGPLGLWLADGYRPRFPVAGAFTVGDVIITAHDDWATYHHRLPTVLEHEERHTWQWLALGPAFLPAYTLAMGWSWLRTGDRAAANWFEVRADLGRGGYRVDLPRRPLAEGVRAAVGALGTFGKAVSSARARTRAGAPTGRADAPNGADAAA